MKRIAWSFVFVMSCCLLAAQGRLPFYPDSLFSTYYHQRVSLFRSLSETKGDIIFAGNSITDGAEWNELFADSRIKNRGISGDISAGVVHRLEEMARRKPAKFFLMIGVNDLARNITPDSLLSNISLIISYLQEFTPATKIYVQSILPVSDRYKKFGGHSSKAKEIIQVNEQLQKNAETGHYNYIDLHTAFSDQQGKLRADLSNDGLHLNGDAYQLWKHLVYPYVFDQQLKPSLVPLPQQLQWKEGSFPLFACRTILISDPSLVRQAMQLQQQLQQKGLNITLQDKAPEDEYYIQLELGKVDAPHLPEEAYKLEVTDRRILVTANSSHGIFNGIQTLLQLMRDGAMIGNCVIADWPSFSWRGYMIDVGRNYQSMDLLKQQVEIMAKYKLNIFHFHPTEDIAWRIAVKQYPQLTAPENMLRDKGLYYSEEDIKELIAFCKERFIQFVPEIDMPGHSAAFKRAMKTDMQTDSGLAIIKNILKEVCETYDISYLHIGADEVKITNKNFVPLVTAWVQKLGKTGIGWEPGGNFTDNTIRQLWMDDNAHRSSNTNIRYIDSRHLYLNHMDPLESVVTIFNRKIGDRDKGDQNVLGGTLCMWHDRAVANESDVQRMNPVYPGMLAFAERSWRGGGNEDWVATIGREGSKEATEFTAFEKRLLDQQQQNFSGLPFPYVKQSSLIWNIYGPYKNGGDLARSFSPETRDLSKIQAPGRIVGGTIIWRHWWAPLIKGVIDNPAENTTWYASTRIWSDEEKTGDFWIGFNNLSRSPATDSPKPGTWDDHQGKVWVNGKIIDPPTWSRGGQKGNAEIPLTDEGYEYRLPTQILLRKGWNDVLIKSPVGSFKGKDWQNPVKWMFTFVPVGSR